MNKFRYWKIGTRSNAFFQRFNKMVEDKIIIYQNEIVGTKFSVIEFHRHSIKLKIVDEIFIDHFTSRSTADQYIKVWESMGFVKKIKINKYVIATPLFKINDLKKLFWIFILKKSNVNYIDNYRKTIILNILVSAKEINSFNLYEKSISKYKGKIKIHEIQESIGNYEREVAKNNKKVKILKEYYDKQF